LDLLRIVVLHPTSVEHFSKSAALITLAMRFGTDTNHIHQYLALRILVNMFSQPMLGELVATHYQKILPSFINVIKSDNIQVRNSWSSLLINLSFTASNNIASDKILLLDLLLQHLKIENDAEVIFTLAVAIGTLIYSDSTLEQKKPDMLKELKLVAKNLTESPVEKVREVAVDLLKIL